MAVAIHGKVENDSSFINFDTISRLRITQLNNMFAAGSFAADGIYLSLIDQPPRPN